MRESWLLLFIVLVAAVDVAAAVDIAAVVLASFHFLCFYFSMLIKSRRCGGEAR